VSIRQLFFFAKAAVRVPKAVSKPAICVPKAVSKAEPKAAVCVAKEWSK